MKFFNYLNEDVISKALGLREPEVGKEYPPEKVKRYIELINKALEAMKSKQENDANDSIVQDLRDKKSKWNNVKKETKPIKTKQEEPPPEDQEQDQEPPPQQQTQQQDQRESKLSIIFKGVRI